MPDLDPIIHQPARLRIAATLSVLGPTDEADFTYLRQTLKLTDGNLGAHLLKLEQAGYITQTKTFVARKPRTYIKLTRKGRRAFEDHVAVLNEIIHDNGKADST